MRLIMAATLAVAVFAGSLSAHEGMLALYGDMYGNFDYGSLPVGQTCNLYLFYIKGDGPALGNACEFKLSLSTSNAEFLSPTWASDVVVTLGTIEDGISISASACLGRDIYGNELEFIHIGTIPVKNNGEAGGFNAHIEGVTTSLPLITICDSEQSIQEVQGGHYVFNTYLRITLAQAVAPQQVYVHFDGSVTPETAQNPGNYSIFETGNILNTTAVAGAALLADQMTVLLTLGEALSQYSVYSLQASNVQDAEGHTVLASQVIPLVLDDWTPPEMHEAAPIDGTTLQLTFSEALDPIAAGTVSNYEVRESLDPLSTIAVSAAALQPGGTRVMISLASPLAVGVSYTVRVNNVMDQAGNVIGSANEATFIGPDIYPPLIIDARIVNVSLVEVLFSEPLDSISAVNASNYMLAQTGNHAAAIAITSALLLADNSTVRLSLGAPLPFNISYTLRVYYVTDIAHNVIYPGSSVSFTYCDTVPPTIVGAEAPADSVVRISFSETLDRSSAEITGNYELYESLLPANAIPVSGAHLIAGGDVMQLSLGTHMVHNTSYLLRVNNVRDVNMNVIGPNSEIAFMYFDATPPALLSVRALGASSIALDFSEAVSAATAENAANYAVHEESGGMLALYADMNHTLNSGSLPRGQIRNLYLFYIKGIGPFIGNACEFKLSLSTSGADFLAPTWSNKVIVSMGSITNGISLSGNVCLGSDIYGNNADAAYIGTIPVVNFAEEHTFTASVNGASYPLPLITACSAEQPMQEVLGGQFTFNGVPQEYEMCSEQVTSATLTSARTVTLTLAGSLEPMVQYTVAASNIADPAGNVIVQGTIRSTLIPLTLAHTPVECARAGMDLYIPWNVSDPTHGITSTCLFYRGFGAAEWTEFCENNPVNPIVMAIPASAIGEDGLEYYITATNGIGVTVNRGAPETPYFVPSCPPVTCDRPILSLAAYMTVSYVPPIWKVRVQVVNAGPGTAKDIDVTMNSDISWLAIPDANCRYGDIPAHGWSFGEIDGYSFDLTNHPGGGFNVWFDVTYADSCENRYQVRLDPEFSIDAAENGGPGSSAAFRLSQNYPNPFNPYTTIGYELAARSRVMLRIFDVSGRLVRTLVNDEEGPGAHAALWDGTDGSGGAAASGIYFYKLQAGDYVETKRMVLLR